MMDNAGQDRVLQDVPEEIRRQAGKVPGVYPPEGGNQGKRNAKR